MLEQVIITHADALILLARILVVALFITTGQQKIRTFPQTVTYMASVGTPLPTLAAIVSILMEFFACLAILLGVFTRTLALLMFFFTFATALLGHRFWTMDGAARHENEINFLKNLSIMGAFLLLVVTGPGRFSL